MELPEPINSINSQLRDHFGTDTVTGKVMWRVVWSDDQYEKRLTEYSDGGILLLRPEVRLLPKYKQWIQHRYILEHLVVVPVFQQDELPTSKISYENLWTFEDKKGNYLPPKFRACKYIIDLVNAAQFGPKNHSMRKYVDEDETQEISLANKAKRVQEIELELFGEQSGLGGTTVSGESIIVPNNYVKE